jgi:tRNA uridine 5-carbamoylmethylation protein Kti12
VAAAGESSVLILTGAPGVGKTTTARILAERRDRAVHLGSDVFFEFIRSGYVEPWRPESQVQNEIVMRSVADATAAYAAGGYHTIVEGIVIPGWFYEPVRNRLQALGHRVAYAVLRAPLATCAARAEDRATQPLADPEVVGQLWHQFADLGPLERHAIDIGTDGPETAADQISRRLEDDSLTT